MTKLALRPMLLEDVQQMKNWRLHEDPWFYHYNFDCQNIVERENWLHNKRVFLTRDIFGLFLDERMIGFISIKNYNWITRTAEMGISLDLNYVDSGYGSEGLKLYLAYVFKHTFFTTIVLRVVAFNERAKRAYEKVGFKVTKKTYLPYEEQRFATAIIEKYPDADVIEDEIYAYYYFMAISKKECSGKQRILA